MPVLSKIRPEDYNGGKLFSSHKRVIRAMEVASMWLRYPPSRNAIGWQP